MAPQSPYLMQMDFFSFRVSWCFAPWKWMMHDVQWFIMCGDTLQTCSAIHKLIFTWNNRFSAGLKAELKTDQKVICHWSNGHQHHLCHLYPSHGCHHVICGIYQAVSSGFRGWVGQWVVLVRQWTRPYLETTQVLDWDYMVPELLRFDGLGFTAYSNSPDAWYYLSWSVVNIGCFDHHWPLREW
jgi:hypothetical protein